MPARRYRPSGKHAPGGALALLLACLLAAGATGALEALVAPWLGLRLLFPALIGTAAALAAHATVERRRVRAPALAAALAAAGALGGCAVFHGLEYARFRVATQGTLRSQGLAADDGGVDAWLRARTGSAGFAGYLELRATATTARAGVTGSRALWTLEILLALGLAGAVAAARAREPFCERCGRWYDETLHVASGSGAAADVDAVARALDAQDVAGAAAALGAPTERDASVVELRRCSTCRDHAPLLSLRVIADRTGKPRTRTRYRTVLLPHEAKALHDALAARAPAAKSQG